MYSANGSGIQDGDEFSHIDCSLKRLSSGVVLDAQPFAPFCGQFEANVHVLRQLGKRGRMLSLVYAYI